MRAKKYPMRAGGFAHSTGIPVWLPNMTNDSDFQPWLDLNWWLLSISEFLLARNNKTNVSFIPLLSFLFNK